MSASELREDAPTHRRWLGGLLVACIGAALALAFLGLPRENAALPAVAHQALRVALPAWHSTEPVNEVVYGTRGFDTFGETFLLLAAVVSVVVLTRRNEPRRAAGEGRAAVREEAQEDPSGGADLVVVQARVAGAEEAKEHDRRRPETPDAKPVGVIARERAQGMSVVARTATRIAAPVLAMSGFYLCAWGYTPGGGFPAGAVMLGVVLLLYAGFGYQRISRVVRPGVIETIELAGALIIIATEALGLVLKGSVSANWLPLAPEETIRAGGVLQVFSGGELIEVATGLTLAVFAILGMRNDWTPDPGQDDDEGDGSS